MIAGVKMVLYENVMTCQFVDRPNRFLVRGKKDNEIILCHMPNPGRMRELLFPGVTLYIVKNKNSTNKTAYKVIGVEREKEVILLDTLRCNDVATYLIQHKKIPGWESFQVVHREVTMGDSRFDLLLGDEKTGEIFPVEVKSCTLFGDRGAMFPDAVTARGRKHVLHLGEIGKEGHAGLLILVHWSRAEWFLPDFHTDIAFSKVFYDTMDTIDRKVVAIHWDAQFRVPSTVKVLPTSKKVLQVEMVDGGNYLLILEAKKEEKIILTEGNPLILPKGYYVYVGRTETNLEKEINRYRRTRKKKEHVIDEVRSVLSWVGCIPIRGKKDGTHLLEQQLMDIGGWKVRSSDGKFLLIGFDKNPMHNPFFTKIEEEWQINRFNMYFDK